MSGENFPAENFELKSRVILLFGNEPDGLSPEMYYRAKYAEMMHVPEPDDLQWIAGLEQDVLVLSKPKTCNTYTFPVCMLKTFSGSNGVRYCNPEIIVWKPQN